MLNRSLGEILKQYRKERNLTRLAVAYHSELATNTIAGIENGKTSNPQLQTVLQIINALQLTPLDILNLLGWDINEEKLKANEPLLNNRFIIKKWSRN